MGMMEFQVLTVLLICLLVGVPCLGFTTYYPDFTTDYPDFATDYPETSDSGVAGSCGGHFTHSSGRFASPDYPGYYPNYARCTWRIQSYGMRIISLTFTFVDIEVSSDCRFDAVRVYNGPSNAYPLLGIFCGTQTRSFSSSRNDLTVVFSSDGSGTRRGFEAQWTFVEVPYWPETETTAETEPTTAPPSCVWSCGYNFGSCSCDSSCEYYGSCCHDYYDYCGQTTLLWTTEYPTTEHPTTPYVDYDTCVGFCGRDQGFCSCTSGCERSGSCCSDYYAVCVGTTLEPTTPPSCVWSCGYNLGSCSCDSSCEYYGSCCHDYYEYCHQTTTSEPTTTTSEPTTTTYEPTSTAIYDFISCVGNCGYENGICSCMSSCERGGYCCPDYYGVCVETTTTPEPTSTVTTPPSCVWSCGYNLGSCSCDSSCEYYGSCCHDYYEYCHQTTTSEPTTTTSEPTTTTSETTTPPSCRWNCGYHLGYCSCNSYCEYQGNCCHDYYEYCHYTTPGPNTTAPSCRWNCGYHYGSCSCNSDCVYQGNCCHDYYYFCHYTTPDPGTSGSSCRWNCGYNLGGCSCNSSCEYQGNCCYDYYAYCRQNTTATPGAPCGGHLTASSGVFYSPLYPSNYPNNAACTWTISAPNQKKVDLSFTFVDLETCCDSIRIYDGPSDAYQLLGNLPQNNIYFYSSSENHLTVKFRSDSSVTRRGFRAEWIFRVNCGGRLQNSGSFSSPYYPSYYHDNANCVWYLSAPVGQRVYLSITDLELQNCCNCDYVKIYDGPSTSYSQLAHVCSNSTMRDFQSTSNQMTVVFRSDQSVVARGFHASFTSALPPNLGRVDCSADTMTIVIRRSYVESMGFSWHDLYVDDHRCRPTANSYDVTFSFPLNMCGTSREISQIIYNNHVRAEHLSTGEITRQDQNFVLKVKCHMQSETTAGTLYVAREHNNSTIVGDGRFNASMDFYPSSSFYYPILDFPYYVELNQNLYVQVHLSRADSSLDLFLDTCVASPNPNFQGRTYDLLRNGCMRDSTLYVYTNGQHYYAQFRFRAFKFLRTHATVYLQCRVIVCAHNDYYSRCRQGCRMRRRRSLDSSQHVSTVTLGPITLKDPSAEAAAKTEEKEEEEKE